MIDDRKTGENGFNSFAINDIGDADIRAADLLRNSFQLLARAAYQSDAGATLPDREGGCTSDAAASTDDDDMCWTASR
jgi:hypothetical protein